MTALKEPRLFKKKWNLKKKRIKIIFALIIVCIAFNPNKTRLEQFDFGPLKIKLG